MSASGSGPVQPRPSSAVVLLRDRAAGDGVEVFMVRRHIRSEFVPDAYVFPGGTVKPDDAATEQAVGLCAPAPAGPTALGSGFRVAAIRECFEEAGVLLARRDGRPLAVAGPAGVARFAAYRDGLYGRTLTMDELAEREGLQFATDELLHWAHWITPEAFPRRYDTHFFLGRMPGGQEAAHDRLETTAGIWLRPEEALERFERGEFPIVFATIHQLGDLRGFRRVDEALARFTGVTPRTIAPVVVTVDGADTIIIPGEDDE